MAVSVNGIFYTLQDNGNEYTVGKANRKVQNAIDSLSDVYVTIPEIINGKPVTRVAYLAFQSNNDIKSLSFPPTITYFEGDACSHMNNLENVTFRGASQVQVFERGVFYQDFKLYYLEIPPTVRSIGVYCFGYLPLQTLIYCGNTPIKDERIFMDSNEQQSYIPNSIIVHKYYPIETFGKANFIRDSVLCSAITIGRFRPCTNKQHVKIRVRIILFIVNII